uniref:Uncharacterized protein n=1 Tax=Arundo donax TaxID=35708 RepID=A0A0A9GS37_ARUDO
MEKTDVTDAGPNTLPMQSFISFALILDWNPQMRTMLSYTAAGYLHI